MIKTSTYIQSYCSIQNNKIGLNGETIFEIESLKDFSNFAKLAYRNFEVNYPKFFKMDNLCKLAFLAAELLLKDEQAVGKENDIALVFSNKNSSIDTDIIFQESITNKDNFFPSPAVFVYTLPNICIGEVSIRHNLMSENSFFIFKKFDPVFMTKYTDVLLHTNRSEKVLCGWVDFYKESYHAFFYLVNTNEGILHDATTVETLFNK